jgi:hypothetical protein
MRKSAIIRGGGLVVIGKFFCHLGPSDTLCHGIMTAEMTGSNNAFVAREVG